MEGSKDSIIYQAGEFDSYYIDKFIVETFYNLENPSVGQIKEIMKRLEEIEFGKIKDGLSDRDATFVAQGLKKMDSKALRDFQDFCYDDNDKDGKKKKMFDDIIKLLVINLHNERLFLDIDLGKLSPESTNLIFDRLLNSGCFDTKAGEIDFNKWINAMDKINPGSNLDAFISLILDHIKNKKLPGSIINGLKPDPFSKLSCNTKFAILKSFKSDDLNIEKIELKNELVGKIDFYNDSNFNDNDKKDVYIWFLKNYSGKLSKEQCSVLNLNFFEAPNTGIVNSLMDKYKIDKRIVDFNKIDVELEDGRKQLLSCLNTKDTSLIKHVFKYPAFYKNHISCLLIAINEGKIEGLEDILKGTGFIDSLSLKTINFDKGTLNVLVKLFAKDLIESQIKDIDLKLLEPDNLKLVLENHYQELTSGHFKSLFESVGSKKDLKNVAPVLCDFSESLKKKCESMKIADKEKYDNLQKFERKITNYNNLWMEASQFLNLEFLDPNDKLSEDEIGFFGLLSDNEQLDYKKLQKLILIKDKDGYSFDFVLNSLETLFGNLDNSVDNSERIKDVNQKLKIRPNTDIKKLIKSSHYTDDIKAINQEKSSKILKFLNVMEYDNLINVDTTGFIGKPIKFYHLDFVSYSFLVNALRKKSVKKFKTAKDKEAIKKEVAKNLGDILNKIENSIGKVEEYKDKDENQKDQENQKKMLEFLCLSHLYLSFEPNFKNDEFGKIAGQLIREKLIPVSKAVITNKENKVTPEQIEDLLEFSKDVEGNEKGVATFVIDEEILDYILDNSDTDIFKFKTGKEKNFDKFISFINICSEDIDRDYTARIIERTDQKLKISAASAKKLFDLAENFDSIVPVIDKLGTIESKDLLISFLKKLCNKIREVEGKEKVNAITIAFLKKLSIDIDVNNPKDIKTLEKIWKKLKKLVNIAANVRNTNNFSFNDELKKLMIEKFKVLVKSNVVERHDFLYFLQKIYGYHLELDVHEVLFKEGIEGINEIGYFSESDFVQILDCYLKKHAKIDELEDSEMKLFREYLLKMNFDTCVYIDSCLNCNSLKKLYLYFDWLAKVGSKNDNVKNLFNNALKEGVSFKVSDRVTYLTVDKFIALYNSIPALVILFDIAMENEIPVDKDKVLKPIKKTIESMFINRILVNRTSILLSRVRKLYNNDEAFKKDYSCLKDLKLEDDGKVLFRDVEVGGLESLEKEINDCRIEVVGDKVITKAEKVKDDKETGGKKINLSMLKRLNGPGQKEEDEKEEKCDNNRDNG